MATYHKVPPLPEYMVRGYFDCKTKPILSVKSGDTVSLIAWNSADEEDLPPYRSVVDERHIAALDQLERGPASHMITGPIYVENAEPGDVLQIDILQVSLHDEWGFIGTLPGRGALPDEFQEPVVIHASINKEEKTARLPWGRGAAA